MAAERGNLHDTTTRCSPYTLTYDDNTDDVEYNTISEMKKKKEEMKQSNRGRKKKSGKEIWQRREKQREELRVAVS